MTFSALYQLYLNKQLTLDTNNILMTTYVKCQICIQDDGSEHFMCTDLALERLLR